MRKPEDTTIGLIQERQKTHGVYVNSSAIAQKIKEALHSGISWYELTDEQAESLDCIATKMARIVSGNPNYQDHWDDIEGYARLANEP